MSLRNNLAWTGFDRGWISVESSPNLGGTLFARRLKSLAKGVALVVGTACNDSPEGEALDIDSYTAVAWGANVIPVRPPADTSARASFSFNTATLTYTYAIAVLPPGTIDSIALYQVAAGGVLPATATAILCAGVAACGPTGGVGMVVPPATSVSIRSSIRSFGTQVVFFTTTAQKTAGGAMRGTMYID